MPHLDTQKVTQFVEHKWQDSIKQTLCDYIEIPAVSPLYSSTWKQDGHIQKAIDLLVDWIKQQNVEGLTLEVLTEGERTPLIYMEVSGTHDTAETVLLYGHMDKQPEFTGWNEGLGPWKAVIKDDKLYGRGGADDGYSTFASITAIAALQQQKIPHARMVIIIEASEESGSVDLPQYIEKLRPRIGTPSLMVCLDSGAGNYDQMWLTTSLRGMMAGTLKVSVLKEGVHSGMSSGIVPSSFRVIREILDRVEDSKTGKLHDMFFVDIPEKQLQAVKATAATLGDSVKTEYPLLNGTQPMSDDVSELLLNSTLRPTLSYTGIGGMPDTSKAGNVLRPWTAITLSFRLPPTANAENIKPQLVKLLTENPPSGAEVTFEVDKGADGWQAPTLEPWLEDSLNKASELNWGRGQGMRLMGIGGSIPLMGMLGAMFPKAQFVVTGLLGPASNAHGPNEFLHIPFFLRLTAAMASVLADHYTSKVGGK